MLTPDTEDGETTTMATRQVRIAHPVTVDGVDRNPNEVITVEASVAARLITAGYGVYTDGPATPVRPGTVKVANVRDYGALGDGAANDTAAFTAALATGLPVYVPAGRYLVNQITVPAHAVIFGDVTPSYDDGVQPSSMLYLRPGQNSHVLFIPQGNNFGRIENLLIGGSSASNPTGTGCGIYMEDDTDPAGHEAQWSIHNVASVNNRGDGLYIGAGRRAVRVTGRCSFNSNKRNGISVYGSDGFISSALVGINTGIGIDVQAPLTKMIGCDVWMSTVGVNFATASSGSSFLGGGIDQHQQHGMTVAPNNGITIVGTVFRSNGLAANNTYDHINVSAGTRSSIVGCNFGARVAGATHPKARYAINLVAGAYAQVAGNNSTAGEVGTGYTNSDDFQDMGAASANMTPNPYTGSSKFLFLTTNVTIDNPTTFHRGQKLTFLFQQDGTGNRTVTFGSEFKHQFVLSAGANTYTGVTFVRAANAWVQV